MIQRSGVTAKGAPGLYHTRFHPKVSLVCGYGYSRRQAKSLLLSVRAVRDRRILREGSQQGNRGPVPPLCAPRFRSACSARGTPLTAAVRTVFSAIPEHSDATPQKNGIALCPGLSKDAYARFFRFRLYSERGLRISRQSRSPRSSAIISTSAVAMLVATGMLYISHIRCSSLSDSLYAEGLV